ncbi:MAG: hypothetical protein ACOYZ6_18860 [Chloroflexota bacterium]
MTSTVSFEFRRTGPKEFQWEASYTNDREGCNYEFIFAIDGMRTLFFQAGKNQGSVKGAGTWRNEEGLILDGFDSSLTLVTFAKVNWQNANGTHGSEQPLARGYLKVGQGQTLVTGSDKADGVTHS